MPKKQPEPGKLREDVNETAFRVVQGATGEGPKTPPPEERTDEEKDPEAVERGRKGGEKGGKARADTLTSDQRREIAEIAATARWKKTPQSKGENDSGEAR